MVDEVDEVDGMDGEAAVPGGMMVGRGRINRVRGDSWLLGGCLVSIPLDGVEHMYSIRRSRGRMDSYLSDAIGWRDGAPARGQAARGMAVAGG